MRLEISCQDRLGITLEVLDVLVTHQIDLRGIETDEQGKIYLHFPNIEFTDFQHLMPQIRRIRGIEDVKTTPFMPGERERNQMAAILRTLPDPVFSIDTKGQIIVCNQAVASSLELDMAMIMGGDIGEWVKGFNFHRWLDSRKCEAVSTKVTFVHQDYLADILPINVPDREAGGAILAGAVVMLKSEMRLGQQFSAFHQQDSESFHHFTARSNSMLATIKSAKRYADADTPLLILGDTGTGRETLARACHKASRRKAGPVVSINCASLDDKSGEEVLWGSLLVKGEKAANAPGLIDQASGGTLILEEVAELTLALQAKLLLVLQEGSALNSGDGTASKVDVRFIFTSSRDLALLVEEGRFRKDLYYRINVLNVVVPSLKDRRLDILPLAEEFILQHCNKLGRRPAKLSKSCVDFLHQYPWPGNVRQLQNALLKALTTLEGNEISKEDIQVPSCAPTMAFIDENFEGTLDEEVKKFERELLKRLYPAYPSTRQLAKKLGLSHTAIANKLREYGINKASVNV